MSSILSKQALLRALAEKVPDRPASAISTIRTLDCGDGHVPL